MYSPTTAVANAKPIDAAIAPLRARFLCPLIGPRGDATAAATAATAAAAAAAAAADAAAADAEFCGYHFRHTDNIIILLSSTPPRHTLTRVAEFKGASVFVFCVLGGGTTALPVSFGWLQRLVALTSRAVASAFGAPATLIWGRGGRGGGEEGAAASSGRISFG